MRIQSAIDPENSSLQRFPSTVIFDDRCWEQIDEAHRMREAGELHGAIIQWDHLAESLSELDPEAACAALQNLAVCQSERSDSKSAIASYKRILIEFRSGGVNKARDACRALTCVTNHQSASTTFPVGH